MFDVLQKLYKARLQLLAVSLTAIGLGIMLVAQNVPAVGWWAWLGFFPVKDIGSGLFTLGLVFILIDFVMGQDDERRQIERLKSVFGELTGQMRDAVVAGFAVKSDDLARVATPETLDHIIENSLALRLGDESFATEVYGDIKTQAISSTERWRDTHVTIDLAPLLRSKGSTAGGTGDEPLFVVTMRWEYSAVIHNAVRRFACVSDLDDYTELAADRAGTTAWFFRAIDGLTGGDREAFELLQFSVNGEAQKIRRTTRAGSQTYSVAINPELTETKKPAAVAYTFRTVVRQRGNMLYLSLEQPTRGLKVTLNYDGCVIAEMRLLDFIADNLLDLIAEGGAVVAKARQRLTMIEAERTRIQAELSQVAPTLETGASVLRSALALLSDPQELYRQASDAVRRQLNQALFGRLYVDPEGVSGQELREPFSDLTQPSIGGTACCRQRRPGRPPTRNGAPKDAVTWADLLRRRAWRGLE